MQEATAMTQSLRQIANPRAIRLAKTTRAKMIRVKMIRAKMIRAKTTRATIKGTANTDFFIIEKSPAFVPGFFLF
jgi:hypothetical protein